MANNQQLLLGEGAGGGIPNYIEEVFSTYLYTGNGSTQTITNGIDLSTKGGMVWLKQRTIPTGTGRNFLYDSARGIALVSYSFLNTDTTGANGTNSDTLSTFNSNGFGLLPDSGGWGPNQSGSLEVSWTFRKQPKFFDVVTYTGTGSNTTIAHNLGSVPGCIIVKRTDTTAAWAVYHRSLANTEYLVLNDTAAKATGATWWNSTTPTSSVFSVGTDASVNASGGTYVAYLFAHDAGGFGLAGTDNVISCGTFTTDGSGNATVSLGYEPQWLMTKVTSTTGGWRVFDTMRGWSGAIDALLVPNNSGAEYVAEDYGNPTATGMNITNHGASITWIYIAIRRGPMKVPTVGTSVFSPDAFTGDGSTTTGQFITSGFPVDLAIQMFRNQAYGNYLVDRLRGLTAPAVTGNPDLSTSDTRAQNVAGNLFSGDSNTGIRNYGHSGSFTLVNWLFKRAPGFFDVVCYTGTNPAQTLSHNLAAVPELIIVKRRLYADNWPVYSAALGNQTRLILNLTDAQYAPPTSVFWDSTTPTATTFTVGTFSEMNGAGNTFVAYLFATCAGVSKVGSYTGNGSSQTIACGFAAGSRFVLIKRTDSTGDWYVWDSARGIVAGNDPHLSLNTAAAEVTTDDSVDTDNSGFIVNQVAATNVNVTSATYIFLAIA